MGGVRRWPAGLRSRTLILLFGILLALWAGLRGPLALAAGTIVLDSQFGDWAGQTCVPDPAGDAPPERDVLQFCFANNPNDPTAYFMVERASSPKKLRLALLIDTNNDGVYNDPQDRMVVVEYKPTGNASQVTVWIYDGTGNNGTSLANKVDWGESKQEGGQRVEWGVSFAALGIVPGQTINMTLVTSNAAEPDEAAEELCEDVPPPCDPVQELLNNADDTVAPVQWSPADALGPVLLSLVLVGGAGVLAYRRRKMG